MSGWEGVDVTFMEGLEQYSHTLLDASLESLAPVQYLLGLQLEFSPGVVTSLGIPGTQAHMQFLQGNPLCCHIGKSQDVSPGLEYRDQAFFKSMIYVFRQDMRSVVLGPVTMAVLWVF